MRYFIDFCYNGTDFHGSQSQPNGGTVQSEMEKAFATILREPVSLVFAGRTDAGVHAEQMIAHFDWSNPLPANFCGRLNNLLPASIAVKDLRRVVDLAHARFDATARTYCYRITTRKDPFLYITHTRVAQGLDFEAMNKAAQLLLGKQDFASFCRAHTDAKTTICDVKEVKWVQVNETEAYFLITADRFLRNMVRAELHIVNQLIHGIRNLRNPFPRSRCQYILLPQKACLSSRFLIPKTYFCKFLFTLEGVS